MEQLKNICIHDIVLCWIDQSPLRTPHRDKRRRSEKKKRRDQSPQEDFGCMAGFVDFIPNSKKCYYISNDTLKWENAMKACNDMINMTYDVDYNSQNTKLINILSGEENDKLNDKLKEAGIDTAWIGLKWSRKNETFIFNELFQN